MTDPIEPKEPLSPEDREAFHRAILEAYPDVGDLEILFAHQWGLSIDEEVLLDQPRKKVANDLLKWVRGHGREHELLGLLWYGRPGNPYLHALGERLLGDLAPIAARYERAPALAPAPPPVVTRQVLEKVVTERSRLVDVGQFTSRLERASAAVCRVETPSSKGTGFLVGRRHVLTNFHVIEEAKQAAAQGEQILCRFDYEQDERGVISGGHSLAAAPEAGWLGPHSPYSRSDVTGTGSPAPDELDYALIRLAEEVDGGRPRLALSRDLPVVEPLDYLLIIQHPHGGPKKLAIGTVVELPETGLRYRYNVTTHPGTSGAPVFSADMLLVGLHHAADPAENPVYNQAVPIWRVARAIATDQAGLDAL